MVQQERKTNPGVVGWQGENPISLEERVAQELRRVKPGMPDIFLGDPRYREGYKTITNPYGKFAVAMTLIQDGRIEDPAWVVREFLPPKAAVDNIEDPVKRVEIRTALKQHGKELKDQLSLELVKRGKIGLDTPEANDAQRYIRDKYRNDPLMKRARALQMPPEVAAELGLVEMFHGATDIRKLQELRSWNVQAAFSAALGKRIGRINRTDLSTFDLIDQIPPEVFSSKEFVQYNLVQHWLEKVFMRTVTDVGEDIGLPYMEEKVAETEDPDTKGYLQQTLERFYEIATLPKAKTLKGEIIVNGMKKRFPSFEQRAFKYDYFEHGTRFLTALPGFGKTGAAFEVLEDTDMSRGLILAPSGGRKTWIDEERKIFKESGNLLSVETAGDLLQLYIQSRIVPPRSNRETFAEARTRVVAEIKERVGLEVTEEAAEEAMVKIGYVLKNTENELLRPRKNAKNISKVRTPVKKYTVIGSKLLGEAESKPYILPMLTEIIGALGIDGGVVDEIANFSNADNTSSKAVLTLLAKIRENYVKKYPEKGHHEAPIVGLTATPYKNKIEDLDVPMHMVYPHLYALKDVKGSRIKTFSSTVLKSFPIAHTKLTGERQNSRWEQASGVQEYEEEYQAIKLSPFEKYLYDYVAQEVGADNFTKSRLLTDLCLNPLLVKARVRELNNGSIPEFDQEVTQRVLLTALEQWKQLQQIDAPTGDKEDFLTVSSIVSLGYGKEALAAFFSRDYMNGLDTFVEQITKDATDPRLIELGKFWLSTELSTKYQEVEDIVAKYATWQEDENGNITRWQIRFIAEDHVQGRSKNLQQEVIIDEDGAERSLYEDDELAYINDTKFLDFLKRLAVKYSISHPDDIVMIDGSVGIGKKRDEKLQQLREDTNVALSLLGRKATYQSRDMTLTGIMDHEARDIVGVLQVSLGPDWYFGNKRQMAGRGLRQGQLVPQRSVTLYAEGTYEESRKDNEIFTGIVDGMMLGGVQPTDAQLRLMEERLSGEVNLPYYSKDVRFLGEALSYVTGAGEKAVMEFGNRVQPDEFRTNFERMAERLYDNGQDLYKASGYNADFEAKLIRQYGLEDARIVSVGAGTLTLQRQLGRGIENVDINSHAMDIAWDSARIYGGEKIVAPASELPEDQFPDESVDVVENAFMLPWTQLIDKKDKNKKFTPMDSERVRILLEARRVLRPNGRFILAVPKSAFDLDTYVAFTKALEDHFGLTLDHEASGEVYGETKFRRGEMVSWSIVAQKTGEVDLTNFNIRALSFLKDKDTWESNGIKPKINVMKDPQNGTNTGLMIDYDKYFVRNPFGNNIVDGKFLEPVSSDASHGHGIIHSGEEFELLTDINELDKGGSSLISGEFDIQSLEDQMQVVRGEEQEDYKNYRKLVRSIGKSIGLPWNEAEDLCIRAIQYAFDKGIRFETKQAAHEYVYKVLRSPKKLEEIFFYGI